VNNEAFLDGKLPNQFIKFFNVRQYLYAYVCGAALMDAKFSIKVVTATLIHDLRCPAALVCSLAGINSGKLSRILKGHELPGAVDELALRKAVASLRKLSEFSKPFPLDWRECEQIRTCVEMMEAGELKIILIAPGSNQNLTDTDNNPVATAGNFSTGTDDGR
jgi:hypothetical protein